MTLSDWVNDSQNYCERYGIANGIRMSGFDLWEGILRNVGNHVQYGENIYEQEWDALLVLDACRVDILEELSSEYDFLNDTQSIYSVGSSSPEWMEKTFTEEYSTEIAETSYVCGNGHSFLIDDKNFKILDEVWKYAWPDGGTIEPESIVDRAVDIGRSSEQERLLVHFMQPHRPFRVEVHPDEAEIPANSNLHDADDGVRNLYDRLRDKELTKTEVREAYVDTTRWVLDHVEVLLNNLDAEKVVITADHSELFGEWGIYNHPKGLPVPPLKRVPWVETSATDQGTLSPSLESEDVEHEEKVVREQLKDLGYL